MTEEAKAPVLALLFHGDVFMGTQELLLGGPRLEVHEPLQGKKCQYALAGASEFMGITLIAYKLTGRA